MDAPRILIARPDHLGDILLTLPTVSLLRAALPAARIAMLVPHGQAAVPSRCPDVDRTYGASFPPLVTPLDSSGWDERAQAEGRSLRGRFDLALLPRPDDPWSGLLVAAAEIPIRLGYAMPRTLPYLTETLPAPDAHDGARRSVAHFALDLAQVVARRLGSPVTDAWEECLEPPLRFVPTPEDEAEAAEVLALLPSPASLLLLHPGSGWLLKNWPAERWGLLSQELAARYQTVPLVVGTAGEDGLVAAVVEASGGRALGLAGKLSLGGLAALQRRARVVIATDSGALHLAAAVGTPVVGLFGPADPVEFGPWCPEARRRIVRVQLRCSPCRTLIDPPCGARLEPACVTEIRVDAVLAAVAELLAPASE